MTKNPEGENGDNIVNKGGLDGIATDVLTGNNLKEGVKREVHNIKNRAALGIQQLNKKQEIKCPESKRKSKEVQNSKSRSKKKTKVNKRAGKWVWFDKPKNE